MPRTVAWETASAASVLGAVYPHNRPRPQDHDQKSSHKGRIGKVTSNASEHLLYNQNAEDSSRSKYPDRHCHRHIKGQEHSGNYRTEVSCCYLLFGYLLPQKFRQYTYCYRKSSQIKGPDSKIIHCSQKSRNQGNRNMEHDVPGGLGSPQMRTIYYFCGTHDFFTALSLIRCFTKSRASLFRRVSSLLAGQM